MTSNEMEQLKTRLKRDMGKLLDKRFAEMQKGEVKTKKINRDSEPMSFEEFYEKCNSSDRRYINIIGDWADQLREMELLNGECTTRGQWNGFIKRNLRVASDMKVFSDQQISDAATEAENHWKNNGKYKFGLKTAYKFLVP